MISNLTSKTAVENLRIARRLFREKQYANLIAFIDTLSEKGEYLEKMYKQAQEYQNVSSAIVQESSAFVPTMETKKTLKEVWEEKKQARVEKQFKTIPLQTGSFESLLQIKKPEGKVVDEGMGNLSKAVFIQKRQKTIKESSQVLADTLEKIEKLETVENVQEKQRLESEIQEEELKLARNVQSKLLPEIDAKILPGIETFVKSVSASDLSGDVYDFVPVNDQEIIFYLGDATGHGAAAGLVMTMVSCLSHSIFQRTSDLLDAIITLNKEVKPKLQANMFMTMLMCKWHSSLREFRYVGAGHECILHYHAKTKEVTQLASGGIAVGMLPSIEKIVKEQVVPLEHDDVLVLFTDGLPEAWDEKKEKMYEIAGVQKFLAENSENKSAKEIGEHMLNDIFHFQGKGEKTDDMTIIVLKRNISPNEEAIKTHYIKTSLEEETLKDELVMQASSETFNPDLQQTQQRFVEKSLDLAKVYASENNLVLAQETVLKALRIAPNHSELMHIHNGIKTLIEQQSHESIGNQFRHFVLNVFYKINASFDFSRRKSALLKNLMREAKNLQEAGDSELLENIVHQIETIAPRSHELREIQKLQASPGAQSVLSKFFSLNISITNKTDKLEEVAVSANEVLEMKKGLVSFKEDLSSLEEKVSSLVQELGVVDTSYNPMKSLDQDDILGLKKLLSIKQTDDLSHNSELETKNKKQKVEMVWEKGGVLEKNRKPYNKFMAKISPMNKKDLFSFIEKLAAFIKAKIPIQTSLEIMQEQAQNDGYIYVLDELNAGLDRGLLLSQAMEQFPQHFPEMLRYLIAAGEKSGALSIILADLAEQMKEQQLVAGKIKGALIYPSVIIFASLTMIIAMMWFIVPRLTKIYKETGVTLPKITQIVIAISEYIQHNFIFLVFAIVAISTGLYFFGQVDIGKRIYHRIYLHLPVVQLIARSNNVMLFLINLAILLENGIQLSEAMKVVAKITPNIYYHDEVLRLRNRMISEGVPLSEAMGIKQKSSERSSLFPMEVLQTIAIGEQTGELAAMLRSSGEMFKERIKTIVKGFSEILEPIMMIFVGMVVATILLAIMFPLFNIGKVLRNK